MLGQQTILTPAREWLVLHYADFHYIRPTLAYFGAFHPRQLLDCVLRILQTHGEKTMLRVRQHHGAQLRRIDALELAMAAAFGSRDADIAEPALRLHGEQRFQVAFP